MAGKIAVAAVLALVAFPYPQVRAQPLGSYPRFTSGLLQPPAGPGSGAQFGAKAAIDGARVAVTASGINEIDVFALTAGNPKVATLGMQKPPRKLLAPYLAQLGLPPDTPIMSYAFGETLGYTDDALITMTANLVEPKPDLKFGLPETVQVFKRDVDVFTLRTQFVAYPPFGLGSAMLADRMVVVREPLNGDKAVSGRLQLLDLAGNVTAELAPANAPSGSRFGDAVAASGNTIVVGAPGDVGNKPGGAIYVFDITGNTLTQIAKIDEPGGQFGNFFGRSVAVDGNTILVGSTRNGGIGFLYVRAGGSVRLAQSFVLRNAAAPNTFATTVALSGSRAVLANQPFQVNGGSVHELPTMFSEFRQAGGGAPFHLSARFTDTGQDSDLTSALALDGSALVAGGSNVNGGAGAAAAFRLP